MSILTLKLETLSTELQNVALEVAARQNCKIKKKGTDLLVDFETAEQQRNVFDFMDTINLAYRGLKNPIEYKLSDATPMLLLC